MALLDINWHPDASHLRRFGFVCLGFAVLLVGVTAFRENVPVTIATFTTNISGRRSMVILGLGAAAALVGVLSPRRLRFVYLGLTVLTAPIGWCVSYAALVFIFIAVVTPLAWILRLRGRDALGRRYDRTALTYWNRRDGPRPPTSYFRQS